MNEGISFAATLQVAEQGIRDGLHLGGQLHVLQHGRTLLDIALGQEQLGIRMRPGTLMTWLSSGKPLAALAVAQLCTRAQLQLDTRVAEVIPEFSVHGKEGITVRHVLTHTGGFRTADKCDLGDEWPAIIDCICNSAPDPQSQPRTRAAYHVSGSWYILGEIVRRLDGRPFEQYAAEEIFARSGSQDCFFRLDSVQFRAHESRLGWLYHTESGSPIPHRRWK